MLIEKLKKSGKNVFKRIDDGSSICGLKIFREKFQYITKLWFTTAIMFIFGIINITVYSQSGSVGINTSNPKSTLHVLKEGSPLTKPAGIIAPIVTILELNNANSLYGTDQISAIVYVENASNGTPSGPTANVTTVGYYYFDGIQWMSVGNGGPEPWYVINTTDQAAQNTDSVYVMGEVGIGTPAPQKTAKLDVTSTTQGVLIPRMTEQQRDNIANPANGLLIYNTEEDCINYYSNTANAWLSLCGGPPKAEYTLNCSSLTANGDYIVNTVMIDANELTLTVNVTKAGTYSLLAASSPPNGYSFSIMGVFASTGVQVVQIPAQGMPLVAGTDNFTLKIVGGTDSCTVQIPVRPNVAEYSLDCNNVSVSGVYAKGTSLNPSTNTISVRVLVSSLGFYNISTPVTNGISFQAVGTFTTTGFQTVILQGTGTPSSLTDFSITINANTSFGTATCTASIKIDLPSLTFAIINTGRDDPGGYDYGADLIVSGSGQRGQAILQPQNFGPNGKAKMPSLTNAWGDLSEGHIFYNSAAGAQDYLNRLTNALSSGTDLPDIILFYAYGTEHTTIPTSTNTAMMLALADYVNRGGALLYATPNAQGNPIFTATSANVQNDIETLLKGIFGNDVTQYNYVSPSTSLPTTDNTNILQLTGSTLTNQCYLINNMPGDPVINGPFANLSGSPKYWGNSLDVPGSTILKQLPPNCVQVCSAQNDGHPDTDSEWSIVWYSTQKNFFYFGQCPRSHSNYPTLTTDYPTHYSKGGARSGLTFVPSDLNFYGILPAPYNNPGPGGMPVSKLFGSPSHTVYNSFLELNAVNYLLKRAAVAGINPH
jgi:hypothetical protein